MSASLPHVQFMTRRECCLCDDAKPVVEAAAARGLCTWEAVNVDTDKALLVKYGNDVPVILINGETRFMHRLSADEFDKALEAAAC